MLKPIYHYNISKNTKLPFELIKGSEKERFQKAYKMNKKFFEELNKKMVNDCISVTDFSETMKKFLSPQNVKFFVEKNAYRKFGIDAYFMNLIKESIINKNEKSINAKSYVFGFALKSKKITDTDKYAIFHETGHFFDYLFSPKLTKRNLKCKSYSNENYNDKLTEIIQQTADFNHCQGIVGTLSQLYSIKSLVKEIPDEPAIDTLQKARGVIKTEINQYQNSLKMMMKNPFSNFYDIVIRKLWLIHEAHLHIRLSFLNNLLKNRIAKCRLDLPAQ